MSFRPGEPKFKRLEQPLWIALAAVLLIIEIHAITFDRRQSELREIQNRAEDRAKFAALLDRGNQIANQQTVEEADQRRKFSALIEQGQKAASSLQKVASSVVDAASYASGGGSYPVVAPGSVTLEDGTKRIGFYLTKMGKYPLYDLHIFVGRPYAVSGPGHETQWLGTWRSFPEVDDNTTYPLLFSSIVGEAQAYFIVNATARNGRWDEIVDVRSSGGSSRSRWVIYKDGPFTAANKLIVDLADSGFPSQFRHIPIYPLDILKLPALSQRHIVIPDVIPNPMKY